MNETPQERRLAENEVIFRNANEKVVKALEDATEQEADDNVRGKSNDNLSLYFYCECADDKCTERIKLKLPEYKSFHSQSNMFVIVPGHELPEIEKVTKKDKGYFVVQKYMTPPQHPKKLHSKDKNT